MPRLRQTTDGNARMAPNAAEYEATIWDRLDPETRREINRLKDRIGNNLLPKEVKDGEEGHSNK